MLRATPSTTATSSEALTVTGLPVVTWSPAAETGVEGSAIALGTITPSGNTLTSVLVSGVSLGATLSDGTHSFVASAGTTAVNVLGWNYATLSVKPSNDTNISLSAQAKDSSDNASAVAAETVTVNPLAPTVAPGPVSRIVGQRIALNLGTASNDLAGDTNSLSSMTISGIPSGATLSNTNGNTLTVSGGSITFTANQLASGILNGLAIIPANVATFSLSITASEQDGQGDPSTTATGNEALTVTGTIGSGGTISTSITGPFVLSAASNPLYITSTGTVTSTASGKDAIDGASGTTWTVINNGTLTSSSGNGVSLTGAGKVSSSGLITGRTGIAVRGGGTISNSGPIAASGPIGGGGSVGAGIFTTGAPGTVTNSGSISGGAYGVAMDAGGTVTNTNSIIGGEDGVRITGGIGTVINLGSIFSTVLDGLGFFNGGSGRMLRAPPSATRGPRELASRSPARPEQSPIPAASPASTMRSISPAAAPSRTSRERSSPAVREWPFRAAPASSAIAAVLPGPRRPASNLPPEDRSRTWPARRFLVLWVLRSTAR
jgi:hypothetical protein